MIWQPTPRLISDKRPSQPGLEKPVAGIERRPADANSVRLPAVAQTGKRIEAAIGIQVAETGAVRRRIRILQRGVGGGYYAVCAAGNPAIEVIAVGSAADNDRGIVTGMHGERLAIVQNFGVVLANHRDAASGDGNRASVVEIVHAEIRATAGLGGEIAAGDAEIIRAGRVGVKRGGALAKNQPGGERAIVKTEIEKLQHGIFADEGHGTIFKFDFGSAVIGGQHVMLANGEIQLGAFPRGPVVGQRIALGIVEDAHIALHPTQSNDANVAGGGVDRLKRGERQCEDKNNCEAKISAESHVGPNPVLRRGLNDMFSLGDEGVKAAKPDKTAGAELISRVAKRDSAQLAGAAEGTSHIGAIQVFTQIHEREERAENARFQIVGKRQAAGGYARQALAMFGDEFHNFALAVVRSVSQCGLAAHAGALVFHGQSEMQYAELILGERRRHFGFASLDFASDGHGVPRRALTIGNIPRFQNPATRRGMRRMLHERRRGPAFERVSKNWN